MTQTEINQTTPVEYKKPCLFKVLYQPTEQFGRIVDSPRIGIPGLIMSILIILSSMLTVYTMFASGYFQQTLPPGTELDNTIILITYGGGILGSVLTLWFTFLVLAALLKFLSIFMGVKATFRQFFSLSIYAYTITFISGLVAAIAALIMGVSVTEIQFGLGLLTTEKIGFLPVILQSITIFSVWWFYVLTIGYKEVAKVSFKQALIITSIIAIIFLLITGGFGALGSILNVTP